MAATTYKNPSTAATAGGLGSGWVNTSNVLAEDSNYTSCAMPTGGYSEELNVRGFDFSDIPSGETILGIEVQMDRKYVTSPVYDLGIFLVSDDGVKESSDYKEAGDWTTSMVTITYGGSEDLWGWTDITTSDLTSTFGVEVDVRAKYTTSSNAYIYNIRMKIYYSGGSSISFPLNMSAF